MWRQRAKSDKAFIFNDLKEKFVLFVLFDCYGQSIVKVKSGSKIQGPVPWGEEKEGLHKTIKEVTKNGN